MPAVRTTPRDVLIRVPKVEPYSNSYVPPSIRAKEEAKKGAAAPTSTTGGTADATVGTSAPSVTTDPASSANATLSDANATTSAGVSATQDATSVTAAIAAQDTVAEAETGGEEGAMDRSERGNSPTLPFLSTERQEDQTVELSKAATSSAGWNSLLVWARRQRGAQWDESTALWQVDKHSREYYSFSADPATTDRSKQPGNADDEAPPQPGLATNTETPNEPDEDVGPSRISSRSKPDSSTMAAETASPPPVPSGRSIRLLRR
ncbi:uncharacterized protein PSANT_00985 [Moesziomyces antarcticus]|uniref:Uncharacterized protein n=1 Tax=Pseudozyma antarctica TaxID=84753 RepID=A0A5C3FIG0_PSEA2|nr:uncharacterized protein PSANT_00985 [Moesziomyces antarcticus]